jgi:PilZ domain
MTRTLVPARQRRAVRRAIGVDCQVVRERDFRLIARLGVDVSPHGMLVAAHEAVLTGEPVIVAFRFPRTSLWFDAEGTIARVVHGRRPGDPGRGFGIRFHHLEDDADWLLRCALKDIPPPLPQRDRRVDYAASVHLAARS